MQYANLQIKQATWRQGVCHTQNKRSMEEKKKNANASCTIFRGACLAGISWVVVSQCSLEISKVCCNENFGQYEFDAQHSHWIFRAVSAKRFSFLTKRKSRPKLEQIRPSPLRKLSLLTNDGIDL